MKKFKKFTHHQVKVLINHLKEYQLANDAEVLHQIRVDIKKIKAILAAMNGCLKKFKAHKHFIPFRNIFRKAGDVREPDVLAGLLLEYKVDGINENQLFDKEEASITAFNSDVPYFVTVAKDNAKDLEPLSKKVHRHEFIKYLSRKKKEIKSRLYPRLKMNEIHKVRKVIKEVIYLSEVGEKLKKKEAAFFEHLQDTIGRLHDKQVLLDILKSKNQTAGAIDGERIKSEYRADKKEIAELVSDYYGNAHA